MSAEDGGPYEGETPPNSDGITFSEITPTWFSELVPTLKAFGGNPAGFILGAVLSQILGGVQIIVESLIDGIIVLFLGSDGEPSATGDLLGIADIPVYVVTAFTGGGARVADGIAGAIRSTNRVTVEVATAAGPASPIVYAALLAVYMVVSAWLLRTLIAVVLDLLQLGGLE